MAKREAKRSKGATASNSARSGARLKKSTKKQSKAKPGKEVNQRSSVQGSFKLVREVSATLKQFWKPLGGVVLVYLILNVILVGSLGNLSSKVNDIKNNLDSSSGSRLESGLNGFANLITGGNTTQSSSILQSILLIIASLAVIWSLRQLLAGETIGVKQAYYHSMGPLIPFLLIILVILLQLLPLTLGSVVLGLILSSVFTSGTALTIIFSLFLILLAAWSIYMISGSIFALYIVTLPNMQPLQSLRSAKNLVRYRRWSIIRRLLFLPVFIIVVMGIIVVPLILFASFLVTPVFYVLIMLSFLFAHAYLYSLYRGLLL